MTAPAHFWPARGARVGPYEVVRQLGSGGMASVHEARHVMLGKRAAIKVLHPHLASHEQTVARFVREGRAAAAIRHPHVVEVFEIGEYEGIPYLVMDLLEGIDLAEHLRANGPLSTTDLADILLPVVSAVAAAHDAGVVHRDLKPSNILLERDRHGVHPTVIDFGISKVAGESDGLTQTESMLGTLSYMAPEHARSPKNADALSDQYSLGVILYECATGQKPFVFDAWYELMHAILTAPVAAPSAIAATLPEAFDELVARAMSRRPADRFGSVRSIGRGLLPFASERAQQLWSDELASIESLPRVPHADEARVADGSAPPIDATDAALTQAPGSAGGSSRGWIAFGAAALAAVALAVNVRTPTLLRAAAASAPELALSLDEVARAYSTPPPPTSATIASSSAAGLTTAPFNGAPLATPSASPTLPPLSSVATATARAHTPPTAPSTSANPRANVSFGTNDAPIVE